MYSFKISMILVVTLGSIMAESMNNSFQANWRHEVGWELVCSWTLPANDSLESNILLQEGVEIIKYRPYHHGSRFETSFEAPDSSNRVLCIEQEKQRGMCALTITPKMTLLPILNFSCVTSGERPMFRVAHKDLVLDTFVLSEDAHIEARKYYENSTEMVTLNCTATGIPTPNLVWTVNEERVPAEYFEQTWNETLKLQQSWSSLTFAAPPSSTPVLCSPEQVTNRHTLSVGPSAEYLVSTASSVFRAYVLLWCIFVHFLGRNAT